LEEDPFPRPHGEPGEATSDPVRRAATFQEHALSAQTIREHPTDDTGATVLAAKALGERRPFMENPMSTSVVRFFARHVHSGRLALATITLVTLAANVSGATRGEIDAKYKELVERFESEKGQPDFERAQTVVEFGDAPSSKTVRFLGQLLKSERPTLWGAIAQALGKVGSVEAVRTLVTDALPRLESKKQHAILEFALEGPWDKKAENWLITYGLKGKSRKDPKTYALMLKAVADLESPKRLALLAKEAKTAPTPELQAYILETLDGTGERKAARSAKALVRSKDKRVQAAALAVLATVNATRNRGAFLKGLKSGFATVRAISIEGLGNLKDKQLLGHGVRLLKDQDPRVQVAAVRALMRLGGGEVVESLVAAMAETEKRVLDDLTDALTRLTGKTFGPIAVQWESWWAVNKDKGLSFAPMTAAEFSRLKSKTDDQQVTLGYYYGVRVLSDRATFIIDGSKSMEEPFLGDDAPKGPRTAVRPKAAKKKPARTRMRVAKAELQQLLKILKGTKLFNIFRFDTFFENFAVAALGKGSETLVPLTGEVRAKAVAFVEALKPVGMTNISRVLEESFRSPDVDTIFLLTDGGPTAGVTDYQKLLNILRKWNRHRRIRINTFGFELGDAERGLLLEIAEQNYGVFLDL
jgi:HEAT repeat protein